MLNKVKVSTIPLQNGECAVEIVITIGTDQPKKVKQESTIYAETLEALAETWMDKDNPTDMALVDAFNNIEKLGRSRYTTSCDEVQNEVKNIYMFFDKIEMFKPETRIMYVKNIGKLFSSQAYKNVIDGGAQRGISWFISRAIEINFNNLEKEKMNG